MKKTILALLTAALLTGGTIAAPMNTTVPTSVEAATLPADAAITPLKGTLRIVYKPGYGIALWNGVGSTRKYAGQILPDQSRWRFYKVAVTGTDTYWYNLGGNQWIEGYCLTFLDSEDNAYHIVSRRGVVRVPGSPKGSIVNLTMDKGNPRSDQSAWYGFVPFKVGSTWQYFYIAYPRSKYQSVKYDLGGGQWVSSLEVVK